MTTEREDPPQDLEAKLQRHATRPGKAERNLNSLQGLSYAVLESDARGPLLVRICPMTEPTYWRRISAAGTKAEWRFQQVDSPTAAQPKEQ